jgi:hypothetical protein
VLLQRNQAKISSKRKIDGGSYHTGLYGLCPTQLLLVPQQKNVKGPYKILLGKKKNNIIPEDQWRLLLV